MGKLIDITQVQPSEARVGDWYIDHYGIGFKYGDDGWKQIKPELFEHEYRFQCNQWKSTLKITINKLCCITCHANQHFVCVRRTCNRDFKVCCRVHKVCIRKEYAKAKIIST